MSFKNIKMKWIKLFIGFLLKINKKCPKLPFQTNNNVLYYKTLLIFMNAYTLFIHYSSRNYPVPKILCGCITHLSFITMPDEETRAHEIGTHDFFG